jgi:hypothetical protein
MQKTVAIGAVLTMAVAAGILSAMAAGDNKPSEFGRSGNQGEGFGSEQSIKGKGQIPQSTIGQDTQSLWGGLVRPSRAKF